MNEIYNDLAIINGKSLIDAREINGNGINMILKENYKFGDVVHQKLHQIRQK